MRRLSFTTTFALVSLIAMASLGSALVWSGTHILRSQALSSATKIAETYVAVGVERITVPDDYATGALSGDHEAELSQVFFGSGPSDLISVSLFASTGRQIYPTTQQSSVDPSGARFHAALRQGAVSDPQVQSKVEPGGRQVAVLDVYVPVEFGVDRPVGLAEVQLSYDAAQAALNSNLRTVVAGIIGGLAVVWALLFRTVRRTARKLRSQSAENARLALEDPLTGLPNRRLLGERLERVAAASARDGSSFGLLIGDLDRFKEVNDTLGHPAGDALLVMVADRLRGAAREADTVARLGGDEFALLLPGLGSVADAEACARRVYAVFEEPFHLAGLTLHVEPSFGLAVLPDHADDVTTLMARADVAMYRAKAAGTGMATYSAVDDANSRGRLGMLGDLRRAIDTPDELLMHYQPKVDLRTGEVVGLEALLRWKHPVRGLIPALEFIPLAEQTGLMHLLTSRVLTLVVDQLEEWIGQGRALPVAVNLSARDLSEPHLGSLLDGLFSAKHTAAQFIEFEITESAIVDDPARAAHMLELLTALGIDVAVDDFGVGNTSLSQLGTLPLTTIKIDRSFVGELAGPQPDTVLVKAIIDLAHEFGLVAVAEGVEEVEVIAVLRELDCDMAQGFFWSPAVPADQLGAVLDRLAAGRDGVLAPVRSPM